MQLLEMPTAQLSSELRGEIRELIALGFGDHFTEHDFQHALGGRHAFLVEGGHVVSHGSVIERTLEVGGVPFRAGYLEAVATHPARQRRGHGSVVVRALERVVRERFQLGALSTGRHAFYERLGWERFAGPTFVRHADGLRRTPDEDDGVMVLRFGDTRALPLSSPIACLARAGDDW